MLPYMAAPWIRHGQWKGKMEREVIAVQKMGDYWLIFVEDLVALDAQEFRELLGAATKHLRIL